MSILTLGVLFTAVTLLVMFSGMPISFALGSVAVIFMIFFMPAYRVGLSPLLRGLEIGLTHGYFLVGPFYKLGPLRNSDIALLSGFFSSIGLIFIMTACLAIYGVVSFEERENGDQLQTAKGWRQFTSGWLVGAIGGSTFAYILITNISLLQTSGLNLL